METKDFTAWSSLKRSLHESANAPFFRERQIWWVALGLNIGFEEDGKSEKYSRPVLVIRKFNSRFFLGVPLSTTQKQGPYYMPISVEGRPVKALISQIRALDARRLLDVIDTVELSQFEHVCEKLAALIPQKKFAPALRAGEANERHL